VSIASLFCASRHVQLFEEPNEESERKKLRGREIRHGLKLEGSES
jgi:hypothetical protein